jgi:hypothetical protein
MHVEAMGRSTVAMQDAARPDAVIGLQRMAVVDCNVTLTQDVLPWNIERDVSSSLRVLTHTAAVNGVAVGLTCFNVGWECIQILPDSVLEQ